MDTQTLRQRSKDATSNSQMNIREKKLQKARRGLRSLAVAVTLPLLFSILSSFSSPAHPQADETSQIWYPPVWAMHVAAVGTASLMGLAGWLVWAAGGMRTPTTVGLFAAQVILGLLLSPFARAGWVGIVLSLVKVAVLAGCAVSFRRVNSLAGNVVVPCMAWAVFLLVLSYKMV